MNKIVHVVGTGTIGEPLIGLFADFKKYLGIDEITFHKRTPMTTERAKVNHLLQRGAKLAVDSDKVADFEALGHKVAFEAQEALERATVVIDCTPAGNENKKLYEKLSGPLGFLAQGSEFGFGKPYAMGINDEALVAGEDRFLQIVSCNTHNIAALVKTLAETEDHRSGSSAGASCACGAPTTSPRTRASLPRRPPASTTTRSSARTTPATPPAFSRRSAGRRGSSPPR